MKLSPENILNINHEKIKELQDEIKDKVNSPEDKMLLALATRPVKITWRDRIAHIFWLLQNQLIVHPWVWSTAMLVCVLGIGGHWWLSKPPEIDCSGAKGAKGAELCQYPRDGEASLFLMLKSKDSKKLQRGDKVLQGNRIIIAFAPKNPGGYITILRQERNKPIELFYPCDPQSQKIHLHQKDVQLFQCNGRIAYDYLKAEYGRLNYFLLQTKVPIPKTLAVEISRMLLTQGTLSKIQKMYPKLMSSDIFSITVNRGQ